MTDSAVLLGCGKLGNALGIELLKQGFQVYGIRRKIDQIANGIEPLEANFLSQSAKQLSKNQCLNLQQLLEEGSDFLVVALAPKQRTPQAYQACYMDVPQAFLNSLSIQAKNRLKRIFFISSTAVFTNGEITEHSAIKPQRWHGNVLHAAEQALLQDFPTTVINASGIYGNLRWGLLTRLAIPERLNSLYDKVSNSIHEIDLVNFVAYLITHCQAKRVLSNRYIATDNQACRYAEIVRFLSAQSTRHAEALKVVETRGEWQRFPQSDAKVCLNKGMQQVGFKLRYPTCYEGYAETIKMWSDFQLLTEFQHRVLLEVAKIPWGKTVSYKELGERLNCFAYRAIGQVLRINPCAPLIPCHRVIQADGSIGGFQGNTSGDSIAEKRRLLASEGVYL